MNANQREGRFGIRESTGLLNLLICGHAACLTVFLRRGFGVDAFRTRGLAAMAIIVVYTCVYRSNDMWWFFGAWFVALIGHRIEATNAERRGSVVHSDWQGTSGLAGRLRITDRFAKNAIEPSVCLMVGASLCDYSVVVGRFVMAGFISLIVQRAIEVQVWTSRARRMRDAAIEQRYLARLYRGEEEI